MLQGRFAAAKFTLADTCRVTRRSNIKSSAAFVSETNWNGLDRGPRRRGEDKTL